jgi:hypothetical protein
MIMFSIEFLNESRTHVDISQSLIFIKAIAKEFNLNTSIIIFFKIVIFILFDTINQI